MFEWFSENEDLCARVQLVLFMLGMGVTVRPNDFFEIARRPWSFATGIVAQLFAFPVLAWAMARAFGVNEGVTLGLILAAAMPGGALSKVATYLGKGNVPLAISLAACSTLLSLFTVPMWIVFLAGPSVGDDFEMPVGRVIQEVLLCMVTPVVIGMAIGRIWPDWKNVISKVVLRAGLAVVIVIVIGSLGSGRIHPATYGWRAPALIILFCLISMQLAMAPFYILRWSRPDRMSVGAEVTMRNMNLALLLYALFIPKGTPLGDGVIFTILFYAATALVAGVPLAWNQRRLAIRDAARQAAATAAAPSSVVVAPSSVVVAPSAVSSGNTRAE